MVSNTRSNAPGEVEERLVPLIRKGFTIKRVGGVNME